jgi:maltose/maltodextrin transport system substrate-binding protein/arabinogalactan oligomer/maltooligosaccharide transport system substrate-binding protein
MNRIMKLLVASLLVIVTLAPLSAATAQDEGLLIWADETRAPVLLDIGNAFTEEYGVNIDLQELGGGDQRDQIQVAGPAGEGADILTLAHDHLAQLVANGMLEPLDLTGLEDLFLPFTLDAVSIGGEVYCLPYAFENIGMIRNTDMVPKWPATWDEVAALAEQFAAEDKYAYLVQSGDTYHHFPIITAFGGYIFGQDEEGNYDVSDIGWDSEGALAAAEWLTMMAENGYMVPDVTDDVVFELFTSGDLAMFPTGPWWLTRLRETGQPYSIDPFPGVEGVSETGKPFSGVQCFAISAFSENKLLAETFLLDYLATDEAMQALYNANPRPSAWVPVFETLDDPDIAGFAAAGADAVPMPNIPEMSAVWAAAGNSLTLIVNQQLDGVTAFQDATAQIYTTIEESRALAESGAIAVTLPGSFEMAIGCEADWLPECDAAMLTLDEETGMYVGTFDIPAGDYEYKVAINLTWDENYGADGERDGANVVLSLEADATVQFTYDPETHIVTHEIVE